LDEVARFAKKMEKTIQYRDNDDCRWVSWLGELASMVEPSHGKIAIDLEQYTGVLKQKQAAGEDFTKRSASALDQMKQAMADLELKVDGLS